MTLYRTHDERIVSDDLNISKIDLEQAVDCFLSARVPGPRQRRLAKVIIELTRSIIKQEEELARIKKMSKEYTRRRS